MQITPRYRPNSLKSEQGCMQQLTFLAGLLEGLGGLPGSSIWTEGVHILPNFR
jgi:hypothetical protein